MKQAMLLVGVLALFATVAVLVRFNFIVIQGHVLWWQVAPVVDRGSISSLREYRAALYFVEQTFESGSRSTDRDRVETLNRLLADFHARNTANATDSR